MPANGLRRPISPRGRSSHSRHGRKEPGRDEMSLHLFFFMKWIKPMPASQHQNPKSDIEISQTAKKRPILQVAKEKLGIAAENLDPYGHFKAKVSMDYIKTLQNKPNGKLILVTAISPTPAGEG